MENGFHRLAGLEQQGRALCMPRREQTTWHALQPNSPALEVMTDFEQEHPVVVGPEVAIDHALTDMMRHGVRALVVVQDAEMVGLITAQDILGEKPLHFLTNACAHDSCLRKDVLVADIMSPIDALPLLDLAALQTARVGDLEQTFHAHDVTHLVVAHQGAAPGWRLRGMVSRSRLERQVGHAVDAAGILDPVQTALQLAAQ